MQTHYLPVQLKVGRKTVAYWSIAPPRLLVIFVHGWNGDATGTWPQFQSLLPGNNTVPAFDYVFYGYDAVRQQTNSSAAEFRQFLVPFVQRPASLVNSSLPAGVEERGAFDYERILLVSHSLGAVVTRNALLGVYRASPHNPPAWLDNVRLLLFAPAHNGAYAASLAAAMVNNMGWSTGKLFGYAAEYKMPVLQEMLPGSAVLNDLHTRTAAVIQAYQARGAPTAPPFVRAHCVVWAREEHVVINNPFFEDPPEELIDADHMGVCKPDTAAHKSLEVVWSAMT